MTTNHRSALSEPNQTEEVKVKHLTELEAYKEMYSYAEAEIKSLKEEQRKTLDRMLLIGFVACPFFIMGLFPILNKLPNYSGVVIVLVVISIILIRHLANREKRSS